MYVSVTMTERAYTYFVLNNGKFVFGADTAYVNECLLTKVNKSVPLRKGRTLLSRS